MELPVVVGFSPVGRLSRGLQRIQPDFLQDPRRRRTEQGVKYLLHLGSPPMSCFHTITTRMSGSVYADFRLNVRIATRHFFGLVIVGRMFIIQLMSWEVTMCWSGKVQVWPPVRKANTVVLAPPRQR